MLEAIGSGLAALLTPQAILFMFIGVIYGLVIGILPGLGGVVAMALLLPFTYGFETAATLGPRLGALLFQLPPNLKKNLPLFDAFLDAVTWGAVSSADDRALQSPFRSGVDIDDYQLDRLTAFVRPEEGSRTFGYNTQQARIAIGSGGLLGRGLGAGSQTQGAVSSLMPRAN